MFCWWWMLLTMSNENDHENIDTMHDAQYIKDSPCPVSHLIDTIFPVCNVGPCINGKQAISQIKKIVAEQKNMVGSVTEFLISVEYLQTVNFSVFVTNQSYIDNHCKSEQEIQYISKDRVIHNKWCTNLLLKMDVSFCWKETMSDNTWIKNKPPVSGCLTFNVLLSTCFNFIT